MNGAFDCAYRRRFHRFASKGEEFGSFVSQFDSLNFEFQPPVEEFSRIRRYFLRPFTSSREARCDLMGAQRPFVIKESQITGSEPHIGLARAIVVAPNATLRESHRAESRGERQERRCAYARLRRLVTELHQSSAAIYGPSRSTRSSRGEWRGVPCATRSSSGPLHCAGRKTTGKSSRPARARDCCRGLAAASNEKSTLPNGALAKREGP